MKPSRYQARYIDYQMCSLIRLRQLGELFPHVELHGVGELFLFLLPRLLPSFQSSIDPYLAF